MRGGCRPGAGRPRRPRWLADISGGRAAKPLPALTEAEAARHADLKAEYDHTKKTLERLRAQPTPGLVALRAIRQTTALLMQLSLMLSKLEERQPPVAVDVPPSKWAGAFDGAR